MEIDDPHESNGSTTGSKEDDLYPESGNTSGVGLPYAPEDFPRPGDKWGWKVGKRVCGAGHYVDRYLYLPTRFHKEYKSRGFASKASVKRFVLDEFPGVDIDAFFASFSWKIPAGKLKGSKKYVSVHPNPDSHLDAMGCKAGNIMCSSLVETSDRPSDVMACDICCVEPGFCRDCCCILCSRTVDFETAHGDHFIRCEAKTEEGFICGHIAHIECGIRSYMAGTVGGSIGLDADYYCRRCDSKTNLVPHVMNLFGSRKSTRSRDKVEKILKICALVLRGSSKTNAKSLLHHVESAMAKLKDGVPHGDIWKIEDTSAITTGELSQCGTDTFEGSNNKEPIQRKTDSPETSIANFNYQIDASKLEHRIEQTLVALKKSQEIEYKLAEEMLIAKKNSLLYLYKALDKEKSELAKISPLGDPSLTNSVVMRINEIKRELAKVAAMESVGKGFGKTPKKILKQHFGVHLDE